ncbi:hypothetical protein STAS_21883 [Striga asiatica]|uniref:TRF2/HOY1 PH-like domain-containing protein n=1 Tax=Striga asiatica TaxID=4170 RepID=A0A5A7QJ56_STRAF|nr:hypothetical protein STAS_21883 [Striga asiatica]
MSSESEERVFWNDKTYGYERTFLSEFEHNYINTKWFEAANQNAIDQDESVTKRIRFSPESHHQEGDADSSEQSSPLGLTLRKTPSFLNLVQTSLSQGKKADPPKKDDTGSSSTPEKLKASNFPAIFIKIGVWQRTTRNEGDLTAKLYYAKRKLVWEVLDGALKSKIEVQWSDIIAIRATTHENEPGTLEIEVSYFSMSRTDIPFRINNEFLAPPHSHWGQGSFNNDVFPYQSYQQQPKGGIINDIESHLMGEPSSDEGTLGTIDVTYDAANLSATNYQGNNSDELVHYVRYNMDSGMIDGEYREMSFNWMPAGRPDEQMGNDDNSSLPPFVFPDPDDDDPSDDHIF